MKAFLKPLLRVSDKKQPELAQEKQEISRKYFNVSQKTNRNGIVS